MRFDVVISNPPYQENDYGKRDEGAGKNASASPLYDKFILSSMKISDQQCFIIPARWAFGAGKGLKSFTEQLLNDSHIEHFVYYEDSKQIFPDNDIKGGIVYFSRNLAHHGKATIVSHLKNGEKIKRKDALNTAQSGKFIVHNELASILEKVLNFHEDFVSLREIISTLKPYGLRTDFFRNPQKYGISKTYPNRKNADDLRVFGLGEGQKRIFQFISRDEPLTKGLDAIDTWKVFSPYAYGNGSFGERIPNPFIGRPGDIATETFLRFGNFQTKEEAEHLLRYMKTKFFRALVSILKVTQHSTTTYRFVPTQDFTKESDVNWGEEIAQIDRQLYEKYGLSKEEIHFIETNVQPM